MFDKNDTIELTRYLLIALGLELEPGTNVLIDQESKSQLTFDGKFIKANTDPEKALYISEHDVKLEPLNPKCTKIMEHLFGKFLDDSSSEDIGNIPEVSTYFFDPNEEKTAYRLNIRFIDGTQWIGNWWMNKIVGYNEAIFSIDGTFADLDLRPYDIDQELWALV